MKVLLIDDEPLARNELSYLLKEVMAEIEISEAKTIEEAINQMLIEKPDMIFLDIHLTNECGLSLAENIKKMPRPPLVIFATAYDNYAVKAFELDAQDYLLKPFELNRVNSVVEKAIKQLKENSGESESVIGDIEDCRLPIKTNERIYLLPMPEIVVISVANGLTEVVTANQRYSIYEPLNALLEKLPSHRFLRVHRAYLINLFEISEIQPWFNQTLQVTMSNGDNVPVSRSYLSTFKDRVGLN